MKKGTAALSIFVVSAFILVFTFYFTEVSASSPPGLPHYECVNGQCTQVSYGGEDHCRVGTNDCQAPNSGYNTCVPEYGGGGSFTCQHNTGFGTTTCYNDEDCQAKHGDCTSTTTCNLDTPGRRENICRSNSDCRRDSFLDCIGGQCRPVAGSGDDLCDSSHACNTEYQLKCVMPGGNRGANIGPTCQWSQSHIPDPDCNLLHVTDPCTVTSGGSDGN